MVTPMPARAPEPTYTAEPQGYDETFDRMFAASELPAVEPQPAIVADDSADVIGGTVATQAAIGDTAPATAPLIATAPMHVAVIYFNHGSANLSNRDNQILREVSEALRAQGGVVRVVGHASSRTGFNDIARHKLANYAMSVDRAQVVAEALIGRGLPADRVMVEAISDSDPINSEATPLGEAANRRADIFFEPDQRTY
jgi:outer membrane protein OmpA-like peptidoglycan-associated protein